MHRLPLSAPRPAMLSLPALCLAAASLFSCAAPARQNNTHLDDFLSAHRLELPDGLYRHVAVLVGARQSAYDGQYVPAGIDKYGEVVELRAGLEPGDAGEMLTVKTKDPGFRDRGMAKVLMNWTPYLDRDFRREAGPGGGEFPNPVTYYRAYAEWSRLPDPKPPEPTPRVYMFVPTHFMLRPSGLPSRGCDTETFGGLVNLMLRVDEIEDPEARLDATHALISWLKGDRVTEVGPCRVAPLLNDHTTGMGTFFVPAMMFPDVSGNHAPNLRCPKGADDPSLPPPCMQVAVADLIVKFTAVKTHYPPGLFYAKFAPGLSSTDYRQFFDGGPSGAMYESLAHTDDAVVLADEALERDGALRENVRQVGRGRTSDSIFRGLTLSSVISAQRDEHGRPLVNGHVQRPPSGVPLEEASFFLHASMVHAADGWGVAMWSGSAHPMSALALNYAGQPARGDRTTHTIQPPPPAVGVREQWNKNAAEHDNACDLPAGLPVIYAPHMEIYDSHLYLPHGNLKRLAERYEQITITGDEPRGGLETPEQWAAVGYVAAKDGAQAPRLLTFAECLGRGLGEGRCVRLFTDIFSAPYCGPLSRLRSSMSPDHCARKDCRDEEGLAAADDPVARFFHENIAETVHDTLRCRDTLDRAVIDCEECGFKDDTPLPPLPNGKPSVLGEQLAFLWIHLWPYGSMFTLHNNDRHFPRYWSTDGDNGGPLAGLMSFKRYAPADDCDDPADACPGSYPDAVLNKADWFTTDAHGYFGAPVDLERIRRPGRGDPMYLLRHNPNSFLQTGSNLPDPSFPRGRGACGCGG